MIISSTIEQLLNPPKRDEETKTQGTLDKEDFLMLLVTQMRLQNPLEPLSNQEFAAQLASFSSLEQLTNLNETMKASQLANLSLIQSISNAMSSSMIGKRVLAENSRFAHISPDKDLLQYTVTEPADSVTVRVVTEVGNVVFEKKLGAMPKGVHDFKWDGVDNNGNLVADGQYFFEVSAFGDRGQDVTGVQMTSGIVTAVRFRDGRAFLIVNEVEIPINEIIEILLDENNSEAEDKT